MKIHAIVVTLVRIENLIHFFNVNARVLIMRMLTKVAFFVIPV
jgi:hypothetical protein